MSPSRASPCGAAAVRSFASRRARTAILAAIFYTAALRGDAADYAIDPSRSVFAVLTHKTGIASAVAHDHLIVGRPSDARFALDYDAPQATKFKCRVAVAALEVDEPEQRAACRPRFNALGLLSGELPPVADADRASIREAMLGASQLDGANFPEIRAEVVALERKPATSKRAQWKVRLRLAIRDKTLERSLSASSFEDDGTLEAEITGAFRFTEFGIEPYSALLGAIRNDDVFHIYARIVAQRDPGE